jgi:hypothetical protein
VSEQLARKSFSIFGSEPSLLTIIGLILLLISGAFERLLAEVFPLAAPARPPTLRLGEPRLVAMSATDAAAAAQLLGSSVAALVAADRDN